MKLKLKIPKTVTERQKELIQEFDNPNATSSSTAGASGADSKTADKNCNTTFTIDQAWKRVKDYWNSTGKKASGDSNDTATEKGSKEAKASA